MLTGTAPLDELSAHQATLDSFGTEAATLLGVEVVQALFEIRIGGRQRSLPSGLHPTNPPTFILQFWACAQSPWGPVRMAQARIGCRSGLRPRGLGAYGLPCAFCICRSRCLRRRCWKMVASLMVPMSSSTSIRWV